MQSLTQEAIEVTQSEELKTIHNFEEFEFSQELLKGIYASGFEKPSIIQQKAIIPIINRRDTITQAPSGEGKTVNFCIGILHLIDPNSAFCQAIIMAPAREIAHQIHNAIKSLGEFMQVISRCSIGGVDPKEQRAALLNGGIHIIVGTPGRIRDLIQRKALTTEHLRIVVLDEADEMLSRGFGDQLKEIFKRLPSAIQVCFFSAVAYPEMIDFTNQCMKDPVRILVQNHQITLQGIKQFYISLQQDNQKFGALLSLLNNMTASKVIVFTNQKERAKQLADKLSENKFMISCLHCDLENSERAAIMKSFRSKNSNILISTDLLSRGIDIQSIKFIINYDIPKNTTRYIHRVGRTGCYGSKRVAINIVVPQEAVLLASFREFYNTKIEELPLGHFNIMQL